LSRNARCEYTQDHPTRDRCHGCRQELLSAYEQKPRNDQQCSAYAPEHQQGQGINVARKGRLQPECDAACKASDDRNSGQLHGARRSRTNVSM
jgi:hypothetical protein